MVRTAQDERKARALLLGVNEDVVAVAVAEGIVTDHAAEGFRPIQDPQGFLSRGSKRHLRPELTLKQEGKNLSQVDIVIVFHHENFQFGRPPVRSVFPFSEDSGRILWLEAAHGSGWVGANLPSPPLRILSGME